MAFAGGPLVACRVACCFSYLRTLLWFPSPQVFIVFLSFCYLMWTSRSSRCVSAWLRCCHTIGRRVMLTDPVQNAYALFSYRCKLRRRGSSSMSSSPSWDGDRPKTTVRSTRAKTEPSRTSSQVGNVGLQIPSFPAPGSLLWCWAPHNANAPCVTLHSVPFSQVNSSYTDTDTLWFTIHPFSGNKSKHASLR